MRAFDWDDSPSDKEDLFDPGLGYESVICTACNGSGEGMYDGSTCGVCGGEGEICAACNGSGEGMYDGSTCGVCGGEGEVWVEITELEDDSE